MDKLRAILESWVAHESTASLWLVVASVLLFGVTFARSRTDPANERAWGKQLLEALTKAFVFASLVGAFYFLLSNNYSAFSQIYSSFTIGGSLSNQNWQMWRNQYGGNFLQQDLQVTQSITKEVVEVIQPNDPTLPVLYRNLTTEEPIQQNSIIGFNGQVVMNLANPELQGETFNAYNLSAVYEYNIINPTETETHVEFKFPLSAEARLYQDVTIKKNAAEIADWHIASNSIVWDDYLKPSEQAQVSIHYRASGMDNFLFEIPEPREVTNFSLTVALNARFYETRTEPSGSSIQVAEKPTLPYQTVTWSIEPSIIAPVLGIVLPQRWPYAPHQEMIEALPYAARASVLFLSLTMLTWLICGASIKLWQIGILAGLFTLSFVPLLAGGLPTPSTITSAQLASWQVKMLPVLAIVPLTIAWLLLRQVPRLPLTLILLLMALFIGGYPLISFLPDEQKRNAAESLVQVGMIAYVFSLSLFIRVSNRYISN